MTARFLSTTTGTATTSGTSCAAVLAGGTTGATAIIVIAAVNQSNTLAATVSSVTDTAGNTYTKAVNSTGSPNTAGNTSVEIWVKYNPTTSAGSQTYTVNLANAAPSVAMRVIVLGSPSPSTDATATLASASTVNNSISVTTTHSDDIVLTAIAVGTNQSNAVISTAAPGDMPVVVANNATASSSSQLYVIFESRPGARAVIQNFVQAGSGTYVAAELAVVAPLTYPSPGIMGISSPTVPYVKDPGAALDYVFNWVQYLGMTETITSCGVTADSGINVDYFTNPGSNYVVAWLSGGTAGNSYTVTCSITTSLGRTDNRSITVKVLNQ